VELGDETMKKSRYEIHLDPPLAPKKGITRENHQLLELFFLAPPHIGEWFLNLPDIQDRTVVNFTDSKYHPDSYREMIVELLEEMNRNRCGEFPEDLKEIMKILKVGENV